MAALDLGIIAGEKEYTLFQVDELITYANPDFLNPDVIKAGGITVMKKIAALSQMRQKPMIFHNTRPTISTAATLQLAASTPTLGPFMEFLDLDRFPELIATIHEYPTVSDGYIHVPESPGLAWKSMKPRWRHAPKGYEYQGQAKPEQRRTSQQAGWQSTGTPTARLGLIVLTLTLS